LAARFNSMSTEAFSSCSIAQLIDFKGQDKPGPLAILAFWLAKSTGTGFGFSLREPPEPVSVRGNRRDQNSYYAAGTPYGEAGLFVLFLANDHKSQE
jgi:hypothetical protein